MQRQRKAALTVVLPVLILITTVFMIACFTIFVQDPTLAQGQSGNYSVTITSSNGYSGSVTLSASNLPQGVSVSFSPNPVSVAPNSPAASTMTVSVSTTTAPGTYSIVVTGAGSGGQDIQSSTFTLIITAGVFLSLNPTTGSVSQGNSIQTTATVSGGPQTVTMSVSGLPSGASASWALNPITDSQSGVQDVLTISTSISTPTGVYSVKITATGADSQTESSTYTLTVTQAQYTLTFNQDPLPQGTSWCATLAGQQKCATISSAGTSSVTFTSLLAGAYSWSVPATITSNGVQYSTSVSSSIITLSTSLSVSQTIAYSVSSYYLTMAAGTGGSVKPSSEWVNVGSQVVIQATPNAGYSFSSWTGSGTGSYSGSSSSYTITMNGPITETPSFTYAGFGMTFTESGLPSGTSWSATLPGYGTESSSSTTITFTGVNSGSYSWSVSSTITLSNTQYSASSSSGTLTVSAGSASLSIPYSPSAYYLTTSAGAGGSVSPSSEWVNSGTSVTITATPSSGYSFGSWTGSGAGSYSGTSNPATITMNGPITETASFLFQLTFTELGLPSGTSWFATFNGVQYSGTVSTIVIAMSGGTYNWCVENPVLGTSSSQYVTIQSACGTLTVSGPATMSETYQYQYYLTMQTGAGGTVTPSSEWVNAGSSVTITATPNSCGSGCQNVFISWSGPYSGSSNPASVTMNGPITETANWQLQYYLTVNNAGIGSVSGSGWYNAGSVANFGVSPSTVTSGNTQYLFQSFSGAYSGSALDPSVTMNGPVTETASWTVQQYEQYSSTTPGYYTSSDYYTYSCASGQLVGTQCQITNTWYTCPSGYTLEGASCTEQVTTPGYWADTVWNPGYYSCSSGSLSGSSCLITIPGYWTEVTTSYTTTSWVDTGDVQVWVNTGSYQQWVDTGSYQQWVDTGSYQQWVDTGSYQQWVSTGGYYQGYFCWTPWYCVPAGDGPVSYTVWVATGYWETVDTGYWQTVDTGYWETVDTGYWQTVDTGYWQTVDTGYWQTTTTYVTTDVWNPAQTVTEGATWNPGYWSPVWIAPVTTTYTTDPILNTSVTYSAATATLNTLETWNPPVTNTYWAWTNTGTV